jgi:WD40 repeat protein
LKNSIIEEKREGAVVIPGVRSIVLTKNEKKLYSGGVDTLVKEYDTESWKKVDSSPIKRHNNVITKLLLSKDQMILYTCGCDRVIKKWALENVNKQPLGIFKGHTKFVNGMAIS